MHVLFCWIYWMTISTLFLWICLIVGHENEITLMIQFLDILLWWILPSTHNVIALLELVLKQQAPQKVRLAFSWDYFSYLQKLCDYLWCISCLLKLRLKYELVHWFFYICDNDMIEAPIWAYYSLYILCYFSHKISPLEPYWPFIC